MENDRVVRAAPLAVLAGVLGVAYWRLLTGEAFFWGLPALQFVPWRAYAFDALRAGHLPLWNPFNGAGAPLFANYQSAVLYPLNWPGILAPGYAALGWLMSVTAVLHLFIAGWGMGLFGGRLGVPAVGRGVSALAFALTSYVVARLGTYPVVSVTAWLPFLLWAALGVMQGGSRRSLAWLALITALVLTAGHAQTAWYALLLTGLYCVWVAARRAAAGRGLRLGAALLAVMLGAGVAFMQLLATADLLVNSQRAGGYGEEALAFNFSYAPLRTVNLLAPNVFGNPGDGSYLARGLFYEEAVYVGLVPLMAAVMAVFAWVGRAARRRDHVPLYQQDVPFWLLVVVIGFALALGRHTPIFPFLYRTVPTFDLFQAPGRWHLWTVFGLSVLAGIGVTSWGEGKWVIFWTRLATAGAVGAGLLAVVSPVYLPPDVTAIAGVRVLVREVGMTALWVALAGALTLLRAGNVPERFTPLPGWWNRAWAVAVIVVVGADLGWATRGLNPTVPAAFYNPLPGGNIDTNASYRGYWPPETLDLVLFGQRMTDDGPEFADLEDLGFEPWLNGQDYRIAQSDWQGFRRANLPNMNLLDRQYLLNNFDPLVLAEYETMIDSIPDDTAALADYAVDRVYRADGLVEIANPVQRAGAAATLTDGFNWTGVQFASDAPPATVLLRDLCVAGWTLPGGGEVVCDFEQPYFTRVQPPEADFALQYRVWWVRPGAIISLLSLAVLGGLFAVGRRPQPPKATAASDAMTSSTVNAQ